MAIILVGLFGLFGVPLMVIAISHLLMGDPGARTQNRFWTDYPMVELGDEPGRPAPQRAVYLLAYDSDKYVKVLIDGQMITQFKRSYLYMNHYDPAIDYATPVPDSILAQYEKSTQDWMKI